jgi:hypothetical protein
MNLSLTITGTNAEIKNAITLLSGGTPGSASAEIQVAAAEVAEKVTKGMTAAEKSRITKAKRKAEREAKEKAEAEAKAAAEAAAPADDLGLDDDETPEVPEITLDDLKGAVRAFIDANDVDAVKAIFKAHSAAKISDIPAADYAEVFSKLGGVKK